MNDIEYAEVIESFREMFPYVGGIWIIDHFGGIAQGHGMTGLGEMPMWQFLTTALGYPLWAYPQFINDVTLTAGDIVITPQIIKILDREELIGILIHELAHALVNATEVEADIIAVTEGYGPALSRALEKVLVYNEKIVRQNNLLTPYSEIAHALWDEYQPDYCSTARNRIQCLKDGTYL